MPLPLGPRTVCLALAWLAAGPGLGCAGQAPAIFVTTADGPEGSAMAAALLASPRKTRVIAGVSALGSPAARKLADAGAELRVVARSPSPEVFAGASWVFVLAPLTADRLERGRELIDAARRGGVKSAALLSVIGAGPDAPSSLGAYYSLELHMQSVWPADSYVVLRTFFYQQNLLLWASDARRTGQLRLPLELGCFAPLYEADVADALAEIMAREQPPGGRVLNLTGPQEFSGPALAEAASEAIGPPGLTFESINRTTAAKILEGAGGLDPSEASLVLDLLLWQTSPRFCPRWPSPDFHLVTGRQPTSASAFFEQNAAAFHRPPADAGKLRILVE
mmetsp:Transcript_82017/g.253461  ORF Transcript_82017/g.253461 Transcript_82017/m.253461 type:complete len:336 (-) Transcript_82017:68-1075(-)